jgi:uncharacterized protein YciW
VTAPPPTPPLSLESWLAPAKVLGGLLFFAAGAGVSWATLSAKAESAVLSAASANATVQKLGETMGKRVDALEASTAARLSAIEDEQRRAREAQIRLEERLQSMDGRTVRIDNRLEVLLDRTTPQASRAAR